MGAGSALLRIIMVFSIAATMVTATRVLAQIPGLQHASSPATGMSVLASYLDDGKGLQLYAPGNGTPVPSLRLNLGKLYRDVLKVEGSTEILEACLASSPQNYSGCLNAEFKADQRLQRRYESTMSDITQAVEAGQQHGIDYLSVPFIRDLLSEN
ncbi:TPA: hypothetical protein HA231_01740 [Candidatus Woesearchaeota archaeon]|nr:hypothetical protein [Candidatus Woesearchaeota archaeon]